jgi:hypothetical protein
LVQHVNEAYIVRLLPHPILLTTPITTIYNPMAARRSTRTAAVNAGRAISERLAAEEEEMRLALGAEGAAALEAEDEASGPLNRAVFHAIKRRIADGNNNVYHSTFLAPGSPYMQLLEQPPMGADFLAFSKLAGELFRTDANARLLAAYISPHYKAGEEEDFVPDTKRANLEKGDREAVKALESNPGALRAAQALFIGKSQARMADWVGLRQAMWEESGFDSSVFGGEEVSWETRGIFVGNLEDFAHTIEEIWLHIGRENASLEELDELVEALDFSDEVEGW